MYPDFGYKWAHAQSVCTRPFLPCREGPGDKAYRYIRIGKVVNDSRSAFISIHVALVKGQKIFSYYTESVFLNINLSIGMAERELRQQQRCLHQANKSKMYKEMTILRPGYIVWWYTRVLYRVEPSCKNILVIRATWHVVHSKQLVLLKMCKRSGALRVKWQRWPCGVTDYVDH